MVLDDWQRIEKIVRWTGLSVNSFAFGIGLTRGENLYQIKRGNNGISKDLSELITAKYPEISRAWILTGEGQMFVGESGGRVAIPCYESDVIWLVRQETLPQPAYVMSLPRLKGTSFAALTLNKAMEPDIPNGATVVLQELDPAQIIPGYPYVVVTDHLAALRTVKKGLSGDRLRLVASNGDFDAIEIDVCEIKKLYAVKGHVCYNQ